VGDWRFSGYHSRLVDWRGGGGSCHPAAVAGASDSATVGDMLVLLCLAAAVAAVLLDLVARFRVPAQPVAVDLDAETTLIEAVEAQHDLARTLRGRGLEATHFVGVGHERRFDAVVDGLDAGRGEDGAPRPGADVEEASVEGTVEEPVSRALEAVLACQADRALYPGRAAATASGDPSRPLRRPRPKPSVGRIMFTAVSLAGFAAVALGRVDGWAAAALLVWFAVGVVLSLIDLDTLLLDLPFYLGGYGVAWVLAGLAGGVTGLALGVASAAVVAGLMWAVSAVLARAKGRDALGFGDVILVMATVGVPVAVGGGGGGEPFVLAWLMGASWGMLTLAVAGVAGLTVWALEARRSGLGSATPFAFGPGLVAGAALAWVLV